MAKRKLLKKQVLKTILVSLLVNSILILAFLVLSFAQEIDKKVISDLNDSVAAKRLSAIHSLAKIRTSEAQDLLINRFKKEKDGYLRIQIIEALTVFQSTGSFAFILSSLKDENPQIRQAATTELGYFPENEKTISEISSLMAREQSLGVKMSAVRTLGVYSSTSAVKILDEIASDGKNPEPLRIMAVRSLSVINTKAAKEKILKYKNDPVEKVREIAAKTESGRKEAEKKGDKLIR